jgi:DNA replication and repair protein RecF
VWVEFVHLTNVRSYADVQVDLTQGVTTFIGRNGQGKTNFVEAIGLLSTLGSHRVATDVPVIRRGEQQAIIRARIVDDDRRVSIDLALSTQSARKARINQSPVTKVRDILGIVQTVLFAPEDLSIVKGDPGERRRFLDDVLVQIRPAYAGVRADYERVLKQRNALLKSARSVGRSSNQRTAMLTTLEVWNEQLVETGTNMIMERCAALTRLQPFFHERYAHLADGAKAQLRYESTIPALQESGESDWRQAFRQELDVRASDEIDRGLTLIGPQRDDISIELSGMPAKGYASHGESWSLALAMRLACLDVFIDQGRSPVLILDDVFAELDTRRRNQLAELIASHEQVLITAAVPEDVPMALSGRQLHVGEGTVRA